MEESKLVKLINSDDDFDRIKFKGFDIYKYNSPSQRINLLDEDHDWKPRQDVNVHQHDDNLTISVVTNKSDTLKKLALLKTRLPLTERPLLLSLSYESKSSLGNGTFRIGIADREEDKILYSSLLNNTSGNLTNQTLVLPNNIAGGKPLEFRLYIFTNGPGEYILNLKRAHISYS